MAYPEDPSDSGAAAGGAAAKDLSPDDFERLATIFRPSWKLDEAPFTSGAVFSESEVQALQGSEPREPVREGTPASNGAHPAVKPSLALDAASFSAAPRSSAPPPSIPLDVVPQAPVRPARPPEPETAPPPRPTTPSRVAETAGSPFVLPRTPAASNTGFASTSASNDFEVPKRIRSSKKPVLIGLGVVAATVVVGIGLWASSDNHTAEAPAPPSAIVAKGPLSPPAPTESPAPTPSAAVSAIAEPLKAAPVATLQRPAPRTQPVEPPAAQRQALPPLEAPVRAPTPRPEPALPVVATPAPRATPRPKPASPTIVHDVPF
jgi:hypothetical protein